jgi:hypothetical protein
MEAQVSTFWDGDYYVKDDSLNETIWAESPKAQADLQDPTLLWSVGLFGAQQAMNDAGIVAYVDENTILPWVPDLVGCNSRNENGLLVVGPTYAGFIHEYSPRRRTLRLKTYHGHMTAGSGYAEFQQSFVKSVVNDDKNYYEKIADLLRPAGFPDAPRITLLDLCRASFVLRAVGPTRQREDDSQVQHAAGRFFSICGEYGSA